MLIRSNFEISKLVNEMLDKLPPEIWSSKFTTFFDPAMGSGQFLIEVVNRLRIAGHSDENIKNRVFGMETSNFLINIAKNKNKLIGFFWVGDINYEFGNMKFDVILGNPPYQDTGAFKGSSILWPSFFKKADELINNGGFIGIVHPYTWLTRIIKPSRSSRPVLDIWARSKLIEINLDAKKYFNVGSSNICYVIFEVTGKKTPNISIIQNNIKLDFDTSNFDFIPVNVKSKVDIEILKKTLFAGLKKFDIIDGGKHRLTKDNQYQTDILQYKQTYTWANFKRGQYIWSASPGIAQEQKKVIGFYSANCDFIYDDGNFGLGEMSFAIEVNSELEGKHLIEILNSKLFNFLSKFKPYSGTHGGRPATFKHLPKIDLTRTWSDIELYQHFGLTEEEINLIETP